MLRRWRARYANCPSLPPFCCLLSYSERASTVRVMWRSHNPSTKRLFDITGNCLSVSRLLCLWTSCLRLFEGFDPLSLCSRCRVLVTP